MPWPKTGATHYHAQLGLPDKSHAFKGLVVCYSWDLDKIIKKMRMKNKEGDVICAPRA